MPHMAIPEFPEPVAWPLSLVSWPLTLLSNSIAKLNTLWAEMSTPPGECQEPDFSQLPDEPDFSQLPDEPDFSQLPDEPDFSQLPDEPDFSQLPDEPDFSQLPDEPDFSQLPDEPDFSQLPELVWTMIVSHLEQRDRQALFVTCHRLYSVCKTESILWRSVALRLGNMSRDRWRTNQVELNSTEMSMLQSHSHQIEKMELVISILQDLCMNEKSLRILYESVTKWPLKELSIHWTLDDFYVWPWSQTTDIVSLLIRACLSSKNVKGLQKLTVHDCLRAYGDMDSVILDALKVSSFTDSLKELTLGPAKTRTGRLIYMSDTISQVVKCVGRFQNLQSLWLYSVHVSDVLLETLSNSMTTQFKQLGFNGCFEFFQETVTKWPQLISSRPDLKVCLDIVNCVNCRAALAAFPSIVPVKRITVKDIPECYENYTGREVLNLLPAYSKTLNNLAWFYKSISSFDSMLIDTISQCPILGCFSFHGRISSSSVSTLASIRHWQRLEFLEKSITFPESNTETQAEQMFKLKTTVHSHLRDRCVFVRDVHAADSSDPIQMARPIHFKVKCKPVIP